MNRKWIKDLALVMAVNCVRNTVIEDYHSQDKITDEEMKALNKQVVDKLYTFLDFILNKPSEDLEAFLSVMNLMYPYNWDSPKLDAGFVAAARVAKRRKAHTPQSD